MRRNFILDTNVLLHNPQALFSFPNGNIIIPVEVIEEIDKFKRDVSERGRNSRRVTQILDGLRQRGRLGEGIRLADGGMLRIVCEPLSTDLGAMGLKVGDRVEMQLLSVAVDLKENHPEDDVVVVSKNINMRLKADALGIPAEDYETDRSPDADVYPGWHHWSAPGDLVRQLQTGATVTIPEQTGLANEYIYLQDSADEANRAIGRINRSATGTVKPLHDQVEGVAGIFPLNLEQTFALDALLDDSVQLVTLTGKAGTGKTLLAVAAGLRKVFREDVYNRLLVFRPTTPVGNDIGFLPGDVSDKMRPWMQPVYDALELIREQDKRSKDRALPPDIMDCPEVSIEPLTYIRGRSIPHQYIIIDEAQNLTPLEVKTVITRVGRGTKIILTGDPHQIDNPYVDALSNGLVFLVDRFRDSSLAAHVGLSKGERSELAETAADIL